MKKTLLNLFAIILAVSMVFTMAPLSMGKAYADDDPVTITIEGVVYTLDEENGTAAVTGYTEDLPAVVTIPEKVGDNQQYTVTSIGEGAFFGCKGLEAITIPESVTSIGESAFNTCKGLKSITIPESVTSIGAYAFNACTGLKSITIPKGVTSIKERTFQESGLTSVTFADESNLTTIEKNAFIYCYSLETITIPESVTSIGEGAFYSCANLEAINIPAGVESIGNHAFSGCAKISTVTIPASVTSMGENAFHGSGLTTVTFEEGSNLTIIDKDAFSACESLTTVTIPTSVTSIGESAFSGCESLTTVTIPVSVQTIETDAFTNAPLETIYYFGTETQWKNITGGGKPNATMYYIMVENGVVYMGYTLSIGRRATVIGHTDGLPEDASIQRSVATGNNENPYQVSRIGDNAFKDCSSLRAVTIPGTVEFIGNGAFDGTSLTTVNFQGTAYGWDAITGAGKPTNVTVIFASIFIDGIEYEPYYGGTVAVKNYTSQLPADVVIPSSFEHNLRQYTVTSIGQDAFINCVSLESVSIPASVESIGQGAFCGSGVKSVTIEENSKLKNIGNAAFYGCDSLESISIPASVESIKKAAFCNCTGLKTVAFAENSKLKSIELNTFESCKSLESVIIPASVESIGEGAFCGCENLKSVSIPASVESIGKSAFNTCTSLESVIIPVGVESIGEGAFYNCTSLSSITMPASATSIDGSAFRHCEALTTFNYLGPKAHWEEIRDTLNENGKLLVQDGEDIIFKNSDGTELQYSSVKSGLTPQYVGATPTKDADDQYTYTFAGWDPEITEVTGAATYTAKYNSQSKSSSIQGANVVLSATALTYNGAVQRPAISAIGNWKMAEGTDYTAAWSNAASKNVGTYSVAVTGKGKYKDTAKAAYQIVPKGTTLKKPKKAKKAVTVKWKKQKAKMSTARISGYQIQLARNKAFTKKVKTVKVKGYKKTSKKVKKLKGKTKYYVRVRTYMKSGGSTYYSPWSKVKTVRTK